MNTCPHQHQQQKLRPELPPLTDRIKKLPVDERGYPVPFFVQWVDENNECTPPGVGRPEFRMMDPSKFVACVRRKLCWVCGEALGVHLTFVLGPMCCVNRVTSEPPSHAECATWSVKGCPFLSRPKMVRREDELITENKNNVAGNHIERNPGVMALWTTKRYKLENVPSLRSPDGSIKSNPGVLFSVGEPEWVEWWTEARPATRAEALNAIETGLPALHKACFEPGALKDCNEKADIVRNRYLPME